MLCLFTDKTEEKEKKKKDIPISGVAFCSKYVVST